MEALTHKKLMEVIQNHDINQFRFETEHGIIYAPPTLYDHVVNYIAAGQLFDGHVVEALRSYIQPGTTVIDVGANHGQMSLVFSKMVGETGHVESIEASEYLATLIQYSLAANDFTSNVRLHNNAAWEVSGLDLDMYVPESGPDQQFNGGANFYSGMSIKGPEGFDNRPFPTHPIKSLAIDDIDFKSPVSAIKVDIQGADLYALYGARKTIEKYKPIIAFEYEASCDAVFNTSYEKYETFVQEIGYEIKQSIQGSHDVLIGPK